MAKTNKPGSPALATRTDIDAAFEALSTADERRIEKAARYFVRGLGKLIRTRSFEELQQEAVTAIYIGAEDPKAGRHWPRDEVSLVKFFVGVMRSITSHWLEEAQQEIFDSETVVETEEGDTVSLLSQMSDPAPLADRELNAKEGTETIMSLFSDDGEAWIVLEAWKLGMKGPEIMRDYGLTEKALQAACKRIRYKVKA